MASVFRAPLFARSTRYATFASFAAILSSPSPNLLASTLQPPAASAPFSQHEWPNPQAKARVVELLTEADGTEYWLLKDVFFRGPGQAPNYDWPNPIPRAFPLEDRSFIDPSETWIWGKDKFYGAPGQVPDYDYPNPLIRSFPLEGRTFASSSTNSTLSLQAVLAPFHATDWPNPTRQAFSGDSRGMASWFVIDDNTPFFGLGAVPNPRLLTVPLENRTIADGSEFWLFGTQVQSPFRLLDWPNPAQKGFITDNRTEADGSEFWLLKDQFFGGAGQPPSPTPAPSLRLAFYPMDLRTWTQSHVLDTLAPITVNPFTNYDWPNPGIKTGTLENRTEADGSEYWLLKDTFFGGAGQPPTYLAQPNPRVAPLPTDARTWLQALLTTTLAPQQANASSIYDWPNPRGYSYPLSLRTVAEFTRLLGKDRIFGQAGQPITIWPQPNPLGYRYPMDLRTGFARQTLTTAVAELDPSCILEVGAEPWRIIVLKESFVIDPRQD